MDTRRPEENDILKKTDKQPEMHTNMLFLLAFSPINFRTSNSVRSLYHSVHSHFDDGLMGPAPIHATVNLFLPQVFA